MGRCIPLCASLSPVPMLNEGTLPAVDTDECTNAPKPLPV
jgi:hypothetical protein